MYALITVSEALLDDGKFVFDIKRKRDIVYFDKLRLGKPFTVERSVSNIPPNERSRKGGYKYDISDKVWRIWVDAKDIDKGMAALTEHIKAHFNARLKKLDEGIFPRKDCKWTD